jgi:anti-sigma regulatory factor (Ser/Thr protein kinase)
VYVCLTNQPKEKQRLLQALQAFARENQIHDKVLQAADLALEEHLTNVMNYGYEDTNSHEIHVRLEVVGDALQIEIEDDGKTFNPLRYPETDVTIPLAKRPIGGLGIHLIRRFMDELDYRREGGRNRLQMRKRLRQVPG